MVTHQDTNPAQHCLTSVIRLELVLSVWCGRRHFIRLPLELAFKLCDILYADLKKGNFKVAKTYNTGDSQVVTHQDTNPAQHCLIQ